MSEKCERCDGTGTVLSWDHFTWECWMCGGTGEAKDACQHKDIVKRPLYTKCKDCGALFYGEGP